MLRPRTCFPKKLASTENLKILQAALLFFSVLPGPASKSSVSAVNAVTDTNAATKVKSKVAVDVYSSDEEDNELRRMLEEELKDNDTASDTSEDEEEDPPPLVMVSYVMLCSLA